MTIWKTIAGYPNYKISDKGEIKNIKFNRLKTPTIVGRGYAKICLHNGKAKTFYVHRLLWEAFNGPIGEGMEIHHNNDISDHNELSNLAEVTKKENLAYRWK